MELKLENVRGNEGRHRHLLKDEGVGDKGEAATVNTKPSPLIR